MYRYQGVEYERIYLTEKNKRHAWKAYMKNTYYICDFTDLRAVYTRLFDRWDDPTAWSQSETFVDSAY